MSDPECHVCGETYSQRRAALGYRTCLDCGDKAAAEERTSWTVVVLPKQAYTRITNKEELKCLNQKSR